MFKNLKSNVRLKRLGEGEQAGLLITSLPWPRESVPPISLGGKPTYIRQLGRWPDARDCPRRLLMIADGGDGAPDTIDLQDAADPSHEPPTADDYCFERSDEPAFIWERHLLRLQYGDRKIGLAMGLRTSQGVHWWEACRLVEKESTPHCRTVEMGGAIPVETYQIDQLQAHPGLTNPYLHRHNWVNGHIQARLHSNGVCEIFAHHINAKYVDYGADLKDAVPVIGFWFDDELPDPASLGEWDGSCDRIEHAGVKVDLAEVARLATPDKPGSLDREGDFLVLQPYEGMELYGGTCPKQLTGDPWIFRSDQKMIPRGMARTLRFSLSLSDRSPVVKRYLAPDWWYGLCEEFGPDSLLPVYGSSEYTLDYAYDWLRRNVLEGGFEDGCAARGGKRDGGPMTERIEPGWEGEIPYAAFIAAWRTGEADHYDRAMRMAYHFTDVIIDHSIHLARMHGYPPPAISLPMQRALGTIAGFLETGDDYLYETAEAMIENSFRTHRNSWPRLAIGRDACFIRGAVMLYRYFAEDHFRRIARDGATAVAQVQREDGAFGDQGGGTGIHQRSSYVVKPWMGTLACSAMLDYLDYVDDEDPLVNRALANYGDWLMRERFEIYPTGERGWAYQHNYGDGRVHWNAQGDRWMELPSGKGWHQDSLARILDRCTRQRENGAFLEAWAESVEGRRKRKKRGTSGDHGTSAALQFLPIIEDHLWNAKYVDGKLELTPIWFGELTPLEAKISTPDGPIEAKWTKPAEAAAANGADVHPVVYHSNEDAATPN